MSAHSLKHRLLPAACAWMLLAANAVCPAATVVINELMASNHETIADPQTQYDDWIEFYNPGTAAVDMAGMYVTDNLDRPTKWRFPSGQPELTTIAPGGYLLLWADSQTTDAGLHAGFNLSASGEEVGLFDSDGSTLIDSITFGEQTTDVSYGRQSDGAGEWMVFISPSPGSSNVYSSLGVVEAPTFSVTRGFYDSPITLELTTPTEGATIYYRLDYVDPVAGTSRGSPGTRYTGPITISRTTCVRAVATKSRWLASRSITATYIFLDNVMHQSTLPAGFPATWGSNLVDYQVDPDVVNNPAYSDEFKDDLKKNPSVCVVASNDDLFGTSGGIYANAQGGGEQPASVEWIDPVTGEDFQVNAGLRAQGGAGRSSSVAKHALRIIFKSEYGQPMLEFPLFEDSKVDCFNSLVLRSTWNYSWIGDSGMSGPASADYLRDPFARDTIRDMGGLAPSGRHVNLYINGLYWGMYILVEHPDDSFASQHLGGEKEDYDVLKASDDFSTARMELKAGDTQAWNRLFELAQGDLSSPEAYQTIQQYVDVQAMIDYLLMIYFVGSRDAPVLLNSDNMPRNFYAIRRRDPPGPFLFLAWDVEWSLEYGYENRVNIVGQQNPHYLLSRLMANREFRMLLADRINKFFFHDGALTPAAAIKRYGDRAADIYGAIVGESARWGDSKRNPPCTRDVEWSAEVNRLMMSYFPARTNTVITQLRQAGFYPSVSAPEFYVNDQLMHGGHIAGSDLVSMEADSGTIWYTLDGNDPRLPGSSAGGSAEEEEAIWIPENAAKKVLVPTGPVGDGWRSDPAFDDSAWISGAGGVGYERSSSDFKDYYSINVRNQMYSRNETCYIRIPFTVTEEQLKDMASLMLKIRYDDGFIIYLNGIEVQRASFEDTPTWDSGALEKRSNDDAVNPDPFDISAHLDKIKIGQNLLAVQGLNCGVTSPDFLFSVQMVAGKGAISTTPAGVSSTAIRYQGPFMLEGSARIRARALDNGTWSAVNEAVFAVGPVAQSLRISEIMYHPADTGNPSDPNTEFIELTNIGEQPINLNFVQFTNGISFTFPWYALAPHGYCLVVKDSAAFESKYGSGLAVVGQWQGSLDNAGEHIELQDALGSIIHDFEYEDQWYKSTDGSGYSLVLKNPSTVDPNTLSDPAPWKASANPGGSPGTAEP